MVESFSVSDMVGGWFVGSFQPTALQTMACEVAVKRYASGATESAHYHQIATEVTLIVEGRVRMVDTEWGPGDIVVLTPGDTTSFLALEESLTVVVKVPGVLNDKYLVEQ